MPAFLPCEIYQYSDAMLKHLPEKSLKKLQKALLYSNKPVIYNKTTIDRKPTRAQHLQTLQMTAYTTE